MKDYSIELHQNLCNVINENPLPISIKYFILKDIFFEAENAYNQYLKALENQEYQDTEIEEEKEEVLTETVEVPVDIEKEEE